MAERPGEGKVQSIQLTWARFQIVCETLAETGGKYKACELNGFDYSTVKNAIASATARGDDEWQELWDLSYEKWREELEQEAVRRAQRGVESDIFSKDGKKLGTKTEYDSRLMELLLKGHFPERYRDRVHISGAVGVEVPDIFAQLSHGAKKQIRQIIIDDLNAQRRSKEATTIDAEFSEVPPERRLEGPEA